MRRRAVAGAREREAGGGVPLHPEGGHRERTVLDPVAGDVDDRRVGGIDRHRKIHGRLLDALVGGRHRERRPGAAAVLRQVEADQLLAVAIGLDAAGVGGGGLEFGDGDRDRAVWSRRQLGNQLEGCRAVDDVGSAADHAGGAGEHRRPVLSGIMRDVDAGGRWGARRRDRRVKRAGVLRAAVAGILWIGDQRRHRTGGKPPDPETRPKRLSAVGAAVQAVRTGCRGGLRWIASPRRSPPKWSVPPPPPRSRSGR